MKIHVKNFRCYEDKIFEFDERGLFLISAPSGSGKSTILMAIQFVLFGNAKNVASHGKTSCSVLFEFDGMKVYRSKRPSYLRVDDMYENDVAQTVINEKFGTTFDVIGYISQNALNSFINMSPTDKLEFLEKFAFQDVDLGKIRQRCKEIIQERRDQHNKSLSRLELIASKLNDESEPEDVKCPFKCKPDDYPKAVKNEEIRIKNCCTNITKSRNIMRALHEEIKDLSVLNTHLKNKTENVSSLEAKKCSLESDGSSISYCGDDQLDGYKQKLSAIIARKEIVSTEKQLNVDKDKLKQMKHKEIDEMKKALIAKTDILWKEYTKDECIESINSLKETLKDCRKLALLSKQLYKEDAEVHENKKQRLEALLVTLENKKEIYNSLKTRKKTFSCPGCDVQLYFEGDNLHINDTNVRRIDVNIDMESLKREIDKCQYEIKNLEKDIIQYESNCDRNTKLLAEMIEIKEQYEDDALNEESLAEDQENVTRYYNYQLTLEDEVNKLTVNIEKERYSSSIGVFSKEIAKKETYLEKLKETCEYGGEDDDTCEETIRDLIKSEEYKRDSLRQIEEKMKELQREIDQQNAKYEKQQNVHLSKYKQVRHEKELLKSLTEFNNDIENFEIKKEQCKQNLESFNKYLRYAEDKERYNALKTQHSELEAKEKEDRRKYSAALLMKDKISDAESVAMLNVIESINSHAQFYLDYFFPDNPIVVNLSAFKETKKSTNKSQINVEIHYKSMECDLDSLSGGELSRVILCFTLALGEMSNCPLLMLDESTASLDQDSTTIVFDTIKEHFKGKIVLVVAHQVTEGIFDKVIKL